jgi:hypothetical protein
LLIENDCLRVSDESEQDPREASSLDSLGGYEEPAFRARVLAGSLFLGILILVAALERLQYALRQTESSRWWASNGRDVLNLFSFGVLSYGLLLLGFHGAMVLLIAGCGVTLLTAVQGVLGKGRARGLFSLGATLVVGLPVLFWPRELALLAKSALDTLAP